VPAKKWHLERKWKNGVVKMKDVKNRFCQSISLILSGLVLSSVLSTAAYADFDPKEAAREREAARVAAAKRTKEQAATATRYREILVKPPYSEDSAKVAAMSDADVRAYYPRRQREFIASQKAQANEASAKGMRETRAALDSLTPEQRAMIERASGKTVDQLVTPPKQAR
jgi:hypothetical protein